MKKRMMKCLKFIFRLSLFCGYFYVLFINLVCGFSVDGVETRWDALIILVCAFFIAVTLPSIIWYQNCRIEKLEKKLDDILRI